MTRRTNPRPTSHTVEGSGTGAGAGPIVPGIESNVVTTTAGAVNTVAGAVHVDVLPVPKIDGGINDESHFAVEFKLPPVRVTAESMTK
jgi:hypothetical protein